MVRQATSQYAFATQSSKVEVLMFNSPTYPPPLRGGKLSPKAKTHSLEFRVQVQQLHCYFNHKLHTGRTLVLSRQITKPFRPYEHRIVRIQTLRAGSQLFYSHTNYFVCSYNSKLINYKKPRRIWVHNLWAKWFSISLINSSSHFITSAS